MKKLALLVLGLLFISSLAFAGTKTLNFAWNQDLPSPNDLQGWGLYQFSASGGPYVKIIDIPFVSAQAQYVSAQSITVPDNQVTVLYFVLDAVDTSGNRSAKSNEVSASIDFQPPSIPVQLKVTVTTP